MRCRVLIIGNIGVAVSVYEQQPTIAGREIRLQFNALFATVGNQQLRERETAANPKPAIALKRCPARSARRLNRRIRRGVGDVLLQDPVLYVVRGPIFADALGVSNRRGGVGGAIRALMTSAKPGDPAPEAKTEIKA